MPKSSSPELDALLLSPAYVESPHATYDRLREEHPAFWSARWGAWLLTRHDDVRAVLSDFERFSNRGRYSEYLSGLPDEQRAELAYLENHYEHGGLVQSDPPEHTRLRRLVSHAFTPRMIDKMRGLVEAIAGELLDKLEGRPEFELIHDFAFPLPAIVIAGMLGVEPGERDQFKAWSSAIQRFLGSGEVNFELGLASQDAWRNMNDHFTGLLAARRAEPSEDLVTLMAQATEDGDRLDEGELVRTCGAMLVAGHETTTNLISNAAWLLLRHPDQLERLRAEPGLYPSAIEEFLRYESPFQSVPRTLTEDIEMHGQSMRKGQLVYCMLGAANRDPRRFENPDVLDIARRDNRQLAFGHGIHMCLGASLARLEAPIAIRGLLERFPGMRLDPGRPPAWKKSMVQRGMKRFDLLL